MTNEPESAPAPAATTEPRHATARVSAATLHRLLPLLATREDCAFRRHGGQYLWGWRVEPHDTGVLVIATNGVAIGAIHDPNGRASAPVTILGSEDLREAVTPPAPRTFYKVGDIEQAHLPDQFQPGTVFATEVGVYVSRKIDDNPETKAPGEPPLYYTETAEFGNVWSGGYRLVGDYVPWRNTFAAWKRPETISPHQMIGPHVLAAFRNISSDPLHLVFAEDDAAPVLVTAWETRDFVGLLMRGRRGFADEAPSLPAWLGAEAA